MAFGSYQNPFGFLHALVPAHMLPSVTGRLPVVPLPTAQRTLAPAAPSSVNAPSAVNMTGVSGASGAGPVLVGSRPDAPSFTYSPPVAMPANVPQPQAHLPIDLSLYIHPQTGHGYA